MASGIMVLAEIGELRKHATMQIKARLLSIRGRTCMDIRCFAVSGANGTALKQGICLDAARADEFAALATKLAEACARAVVEPEECETA